MAVDFLMILGAMPVKQNRHTTCKSFYGLLIGYAAPGL